MNEEKGLKSLNWRVVSLMILLALTTSLLNPSKANADDSFNHLNMHLNSTIIIEPGEVKIDLKEVKVKKVLTKVKAWENFKEVRSKHLKEAAKAKKEGKLYSQKYYSQILELQKIPYSKEIKLKDIKLKTRKVSKAAKSFKASIRVKPEPVKVIEEKPEIKFEKASQKAKPEKVKEKKYYVKHCTNVKIVLDSPLLDGHLGVADWYNDMISVKSGLSYQKTKDILLHECAHIKQYKAFKGDVGKLKKSLNKIYGGTGLSGVERSADCIALQWGAHWAYYNTQCAGSKATATSKILKGKSF